jgi:hypothetical protein
MRSVATARQERDRAVAAAHRLAEDAETRPRTAERETAQARQAAESARAELDRAHDAADRQVTHLREDAARERAELRAVFEAQVAAVEEARADLRSRAEHAEAELEHARADRDQSAGQLPGGTGQPQPAQGRCLDTRHHTSQPGPQGQLILDGFTVLTRVIWQVLDGSPLAGSGCGDRAGSAPVTAPVAWPGSPSTSHLAGGCRHVRSVSGR